MSSILFCIDFKRIYDKQNFLIWQISVNSVYHITICPRCVDHCTCLCQRICYTIDFTNNTITVKHTVTSCTIDGKKVIEAKDRAKSKASLRTLPLVPAFREKLLEVKKQQEEYKRLCGRSYCKDYLDYICVDPIGERISPNYITAAFPQLLVKNGLRRIRFHDLRHSCASLLLANGVPMKQIQEWLGHSDFSTTANFYAHLEYQSKMSSASAMMQGVDLSGITGA